MGFFLLLIIQIKLKVSLITLNCSTIFVNENEKVFVVGQNGNYQLGFNSFNYININNK